MPELGFAEEVVGFNCQGDRLWGIVSRPLADKTCADTGVVIIVGGPQYRVGSHRQFALLARALAVQGYPVMRFDYRGMGDAEGELRNFNLIADDIDAALAAMLRASPRLKRLVVWGLCDAASAALMFASSDDRVTGIVAANPWARSDASLAATYVKRYYLARLLQHDFWRKLVRGEFSLTASARSLWHNLAGMRAGAKAEAAQPSFQALMAAGLRGFRGPVLLLLSGNDLTAQEFLLHTQSSPLWRGALDDPKITRVDMPDADHTFSTQHWQAQLENATLSWLRQFDHGLARGPTAEGRA
jgi:uncharacterized protein